jgi:hypothetical protein
VTKAEGGSPVKEPGFPLSGEAIDAFAGFSVAMGGILRGGEATNIVAAYVCDGSSNLVLYPAALPSIGAHQNANCAAMDNRVAHERF